MKAVRMLGEAIAALLEEATSEECSDYNALKNKPKIPTPEELWDIVEPTLAMKIDERISDRFTTLTIERIYNQSTTQLHTAGLTVSSIEDIPDAYLVIANVIGFRVEIVGQESGARLTGTLAGIERAENVVTFDFVNEKWDGSFAKGEPLRISFGRYGR